MTGRAGSHWTLLGSSIAVGLLAALAGGYCVAMIPVASIDRFALAAMSFPTLWVLVCLHILLAMRPYRWSAAYTTLAVLMLGASLLPRVFA